MSLGKVSAMSNEDDLRERGYYYNITTGEVEQGMVWAWKHRMGPYATRQEAADALATAQRRNDSWDQAEKEWQGE